jgi:crossover junction endodeoxyribonuclease RuvC
MATLKDVARETGLTVSTVSRVLNNRGYISQEARKKVQEAMRKLDYQPNEMAIEELFFNNNTTTGIAVAEARGVILLSAIRHGIETSEYTPLQVKQAVVGYGRAEKNQVISMVTSLLKLKEAPKPDDTADALAIALCHAQSSNSLMAKYYNK